MAAFAGLRGTGSWGTSERPQNFREMILWANPNGPSPLFAMMAKARKESVNDPQFHWWEEKLTNLRLRINDATGYTAASTTITVDAAGTETDLAGGLHLREGDVVMVEKTELAAYDNELMLVSSVTNDTTVVFKRGQAGSTAVGIADNTYLTKVGSAFEEGATSPTHSGRNPTKFTNYVQIFKTKVAVTATADATYARTGDAWMNDKKRRSFDHARDIEWALLFGQAYEDTTGTHPKRYTAGLRELITSNRKIYTTSPTEDDLLDQMSPLFDWTGEGSTNERIMLAGNGFLNELNKLARNSSSTRINYDGTIDVYGMRLQKWVLPQGTLGIYPHPLMSTHGRFKYSAFTINPKGIIWRPLRDTKFKDNVQANDSDSHEGLWVTEGGMELHHEFTMGYLGNFVI